MKIKIEIKEMAHNRAVAGSNPAGPTVDSATSHVRSVEVRDGDENDTGGDLG